MNVRTMIQTRIDEISAEENRLISNLARQRQIVDASALLEVLHERNILNKMLGNEYSQGWLSIEALEMEAHFPKIGGSNITQ